MKRGYVAKYIECSYNFVLMKRGYVAKYIECSYNFVLMKRGYVAKYIECSYNFVLMKHGYVAKYIECSYNCVLMKCWSLPLEAGWGVGWVRGRSASSRVACLSRIAEHCRAHSSRYCCSNYVWKDKMFIGY